MIFENQNFAPNDPAEGWNGTYRGQVVGPGVYVYVVEVIFTGGIRKLFEGNITVIR